MSIIDSGLRTQDSGLRTQDSGLRTQDSGLRTQDSGLRTRTFLSLFKALIRFSILTPLRKLKKSLKQRKKITRRYKFHDRRKNSSTLILILAGYKPFVWDDVFARIRAFAPGDADVCIVSSGVYSEALAEFAEKYNWSYVSTKRNCLPLALNMGISLHPSAEFIYKIDEDIFVTRNLFDVLMKTYEQVKTDGEYEAGIVCPLIPVNVYGHMRILEKLGIRSEYENCFGKTGFIPFQKTDVWKNPDAAKFFWGEGGIVPHIDDMAERFYAGKLEYTACPISFSVGCIFFRRDVWSDLEKFNVPLRGTGMGGEENDLCCLAMKDSKVVIVSENTVAGHLSFGPQNAGMKEYYLQHRDRFRLS